MRTKKFSIWGRKLLPLGMIIAVLFSFFVVSSSAAGIQVVYNSSASLVTGGSITEVTYNGNVLSDNTTLDLSAGNVITLTLSPSSGYSSASASIALCYMNSSNVLSRIYLEYYSNISVEYLENGNAIYSIQFTTNVNDGNYQSQPLGFLVSFRSGISFDIDNNSSGVLSPLPNALPDIDYQLNTVSVLFTPASGKNISDYNVISSSPLFNVEFDNSNLVISYQGNDVSSSDYPSFTITQNTTREESIITAIIDTIVSFFQGIGSSLVSTFDSLVLDGSGNLTSLAIWGLSFVGLGFAMSVIYILFRKLS